MFPGLHRLRDAKTHLVTLPTPRDELAAALRCLSQASSRRHEWPRSMSDRAETLLEATFRHGGIDDGIARLTESEAAATADAVRSFIDDAEAFGRRPADTRTRTKAS